MRLFLAVFLFLCCLFLAQPCFAAVSANTVWECETGGADTNGAAFNPTNASMTTDLTATSATGASPVVSSVSYSFAAGDVGAYVFIQSGTNWVPGWYKIASVSTGSATLTASIGNVVLYKNAARVNASAGCATTATPSGGVWTVDYTQQAGTTMAVTDAVAAGTTTITSASALMTPAMVGNLAYMTGGTGSLAAGRYEIVSYTNATTVVVDRNIATGTGITMNVGGAMLTLTGLASSTAGMIGSNKAFIQSGTYNVTANITFAQAVTSSATVPATTLIGYSTIRGDIYYGSSNQSSRPAITCTSALGSGIILLESTGTGFKMKNLIVTKSGSGTYGYAFYGSANTFSIINCKVGYFLEAGITLNSSSSSAVYCEVTGGAGTGIAGIYTSNAACSIFGCWSHDNTGCPGFETISGSSFVQCISSNNSGSTSHGFLVNTNSAMPTFKDCVAYNNGGSGISMLSSCPTMVLLNNILSTNGAYGINCTTASAGYAPSEAWDGNAYYNNTLGTINTLNDVSVNPINGVAPYVPFRDVICSADPFVGASSNNFQLNTTAGGGAALRATGITNTFPGMTGSNSVGYKDFGAVQHQDTGGGGSSGGSYTYCGE